MQINARVCLFTVMLCEETMLETCKKSRWGGVYIQQWNSWRNENGCVVLLACLRALVLVRMCKSPCHAFAGESTVAVSVSPKQIKYGFITVRAERWKTLRAMMLLDIAYLDNDMRYVRRWSCPVHNNITALSRLMFCLVFSWPLVWS